jgi:cellulose biosynthesis protein BcsE
MNDPSKPIAMVPTVRIGIRGLPHLTNSMINGGLYALIAETSSARFPMLASSLDSAIKDGLSCTVVVPSNPEQFIQRIESFGQVKVGALYAQNRLQFFVMQEEFSKKMFRYGAEGFVDELDRFDIPDGSYLIFDQADELISLHDMSMALDQVDVLGKWLAQHQITALLVFSRVTEAHASTLNVLMDNFTGIVRLGADQNGLRLNFDYWQSPEGTVAARHFNLITLESELYEATLKVTASDQAAEEGGDSVEVLKEEEGGPYYFYMDPDLDSLAKQMPGIWQRVDTFVGLMHASRNHRRSTTIFCYQQDTNLRQLAEAVHTMRLNLGRHALIVVQEKNASLRYQNEALLLRLGINLIVHRDVQGARFPLMLESLNGQIFSRDVDINFEAALASVSPTRLRGYTTATRFAREVEMLLERSATLSIPSALIVGKPANRAPITDILKLVKMSRPGDLITADAKNCYIFLNACQQTVMLNTLERLLGMPVDKAMENVRFLIKKEEVQPELAVLLRAGERGEAPDYSALVPTIPENAPPPERPKQGPAPALSPSTGAASPPSVATQSQRVATPPDATRAINKTVPAFLAGFAEPPKTPAVAPPIPAPVQNPAPVFSGGVIGKTPPENAFGQSDAPRATRSAPAVRR